MIKFDNKSKQALNAILIDAVFYCLGGDHVVANGLCDDVHVESVMIWYPCAYPPYYVTVIYPGDYHFDN